MTAQQTNAILAYAHGACLAGPAGIGVVLVVGGYRREISEPIGEGTRDTAALRAILRALESIRQRDRPVIVHSDSEYAIGVLTKGWRIGANTALIDDIRALAATFAQLTFAWVPGHAGVVENERCDRLAREAVEANRYQRETWRASRAPGPS